MRFLPVLALALVTACSLSPSEVKNEPSDPTKETFAASLGIDIATMQQTALGVFYRDSIVGTGTLVTETTPNVAYRWRLYLKNGSVVAQDPGTPDVVVLADISPVGLKDGIIGMRVGGKRLLVIPSALGFGNALVAGVPANSTLIYSITLTDTPTAPPGP